MTTAQLLAFAATFSGVLVFGLVATGVLFALEWLCDVREAS